jgi:hypothetical protein
MRKIEREPLDDNGLWPSWPHPESPDDAWEDASNGDAVCAHCGGRGAGSPDVQVAPLSTIVHEAGCPKEIK